MLIIAYFMKEVNSMYNFNGSKKKKQVVAIISLIVIAAMVVTTLVSALIYG